MRLPTIISFPRCRPRTITMMAPTIIKASTPAVIIRIQTLVTFRMDINAHTAIRLRTRHHHVNLIIRATVCPVEQWRATPSSSSTTMARHRTMSLIGRCGVPRNANGATTEDQSLTTGITGKPQSTRCRMMKFLHAVIENIYPYLTVFAHEFLWCRTDFFCM
jgi:hypothetical protein